MELAAIVLAINLIAFIVMGFDKARAKRGERRVPEKTLFLLASAFGSLGIFFGMRYFRHKTQKNQFRFGIPFLLFVQLGILVYILWWIYA